MFAQARGCCPITTKAWRGRDGWVGKSLNARDYRTTVHLGQFVSGILGGLKISRSTPSKINTRGIFITIISLSSDFENHIKSQILQKKVQTASQLHSFHMLARLCSISFKLGFSSMWTETSQMFKLGLEKAGEPEIKLPTSVGSYRNQGNSRKNIYFCFIDCAKAFDCGSQQTVENT